MGMVKLSGEDLGVHEISNDPTINQRNCRSVGQARVQSKQEKIF